MTKQTIYVDVIGPYVYGKWLHSDRYEYKIRKLADNEPTDLVIFTGGSDVSPHLYHESPHCNTVSNEVRDRKEVKIFEACADEDVPMVGICRGSQFLTVMNGGKLIQDVGGHAIGAPHRITLFDGSHALIASTHHQMHYPFDLQEDEYKILGWSTEKLGKGTYMMNDTTRLNALNVDGFIESEVIHFPYTRSLGIQGHPEYDSTPEETRQKLTQFVDALIDSTL
jgi:putative glutamine amidotransferase